MVTLKQLEKIAYSYNTAMAKAMRKAIKEKLCKTS